MEKSKRIGWLLRKERKAKGISLSYVASMVGITSSALGRKETGTGLSLTDPGQIEKYCEAIGIDPGPYLRMIPEEPPALDRLLQIKVPSAWWDQLHEMAAEESHRGAKTNPSEMIRAAIQKHWNLEPKLPDPHGFGD